jgi:predicted DNA-binding transcriptional regulator AlpA
MRRDDAAAYLGISTSKFDDWVARKLMPSPKRQDGVVVWDRYRLDRAFESLPDDADTGVDSWAHLNGGNKIAVR